MKIKPEHYQHMKAAIDEVVKRVNPTEYRAQIVAEGKSKDPDKRVRWDYSYAAKLSRFFCDEIYPYADDSHIDTALRQIFKDLTNA